MSKIEPIKYTDTDYIREYQVKDIFQMGETPYLVYGKTTSGKTTLCKDILYQHAKEASTIYFFTNTQQTIGNADSKFLPEICYIEPTYENMLNIFTELFSKADAVKQTVDTARSILKSNMEDRYYNELNKALTKCKELCVDPTEYEILATEIIATMAYEYFEINNNIDKCPRDVMAQIRGLYSKVACPIIIFDDVTGAITELKNSTQKVMYNESTMPMYKAFGVLLKDMFTRIRHLRGMTVMFMHDFDTLPEDAQKNANTFVFLDKDSCASFASKPSLCNTDLIKGAFKGALQQVYNNKYYFIAYYKVPSIYNQNTRPAMLAFGKADLHNDMPELSKEYSTYISDFKDTYLKPTQQAQVVNYNVVTGLDPFA